MQTEFACLLCGGFMAVIAIIKAYLQAHNGRHWRWRQQLERPRHEDNDPGQQLQEPLSTGNSSWPTGSCHPANEPSCHPAILRPCVCPVQVCGHLTAHIGNYLHIGTGITHTEQQKGGQGKEGGVQGQSNALIRTIFFLTVHTPESNSVRAAGLMANKSPGLNCNRSSAGSAA